MLRPEYSLIVPTIAALAILAASTAFGETTKIPHKLSAKTAAALAALATGDHSEYFDRQPGMSDPFFVFDGIPPKQQAGSFGFFAVNPWTGDVWALWGCHTITNPAVRALQARIRRRFTREELEQYTRLGDIKPLCIVEVP